MKLFMTVTVLGRPFQPNLRFMRKTGDFQVLYFRLVALPANIRLGWKGLPGTNTLAYYEQ